MEENIPIYLIEKIEGKFYPKQIEYVTEKDYWYVHFCGTRTFELNASSAWNFEQEIYFYTIDAAKTFIESQIDYRKGMKIPIS